MALNLDVVGKTVGPVARSYGWQEVVLYALGVGAGPDELEYVYEPRLRAIPSFATVATYDLSPQFFSLSGLDPAGLVHGEHELILHRTIPPQGGAWTSEGRITAVYDKGRDKGALVVAQVDTLLAGHRLCTNVATYFARLDGGFGGDPGPRDRFDFPDRAPDVTEAAHPPFAQPLIYRLSGDPFALHVDPDLARASGFRGPIMHGLCTYGYACRAAVKHLFPAEPERLARFRARFSRALYPGVPIQTQIWRVGEGRALLRTVNAETGEVVLDRGLVEWLEPGQERWPIGGPSGSPPAAG